MKAERHARVARDACVLLAEATAPISWFTFLREASLAPCEQGSVRGRHGHVCHRWGGRGSRAGPRPWHADGHGYGWGGRRGAAGGGGGVAGGGPGEWTWLRWLTGFPIPSPARCPDCHMCRVPQWGWHLSGAVQRRCGPGSSRHVPSPALVVLCGPSAIVLHPRDDTTTLADVLQAHAARGRPVGEALALRYAAQVRPRLVAGAGPSAGLGVPTACHTHALLSCSPSAAWRASIAQEWCTATCRPPRWSSPPTRQGTGRTCR